MILNNMTAKEDQLELVFGCVKNADRPNYHSRQDEENVIRRVDEL